MGVYEFDRAQLSARSCNCSSNGTADATVGETCIIAQKIFDQCRIQKCLTSAILGPARAGKNALAICTISDNPFTGEATTAEERQLTFTAMMEIALEIA